MIEWRNEWIIVSGVALRVGRRAWSQGAIATKFREAEDERRAFSQDKRQKSQVEERSDEPNVVSSAKPNPASAGTKVKTRIEEFDYLKKSHKVF